MHYLTPYRKGTPLTSYLRLLRFLVSMELSNDAKLLYALPLDRAGISAENGFTEPNGTIRLYFTLNEAKEYVMNQQPNQITASKTPCSLWTTVIPVRTFKDRAFRK